jgi:hypothetical protein
VQIDRFKLVEQLIDVQGLFEPFCSGDPEFQIGGRKKQDGDQDGHKQNADDQLSESAACVFVAHAVILAAAGPAARTG